MTPVPIGGNLPPEPHPPCLPVFMMPNIRLAPNLLLEQENDFLTFLLQELKEGAEKMDARTFHLFAQELLDGLE